MRKDLAVVGAILVAITFTREARADDGATEMNSPFALGLGLVLTSAGTAGLAAGGHLFSTGMDACDALPRDVMPTEGQIDDCVGGANRKVAGVVSMIAGGAFVLGGIPLVIVGAVPVASGADPTAARATLRASLGPRMLGPTFELVY